MDEKILAYRSELQKRSENTPFWTKTILTVEEAAAYTGIGRAKIRQIISQGNCPFTVNNGTQICVIREAFIDYLDKQFRIILWFTMTTAPMEAKKAAILMSIRRKLRLEREKCQCSVL